MTALSVSAGKRNNRKKDMPLLRTIHKSFKELTESEMESLAGKFKCPNPKRPWQYWPLGCHHRHDDLKDDPEFAHMGWQPLGGPICTYYKKCLRNCRGIRSEHNKCINPLTQVLTRGIKCNCKCSYACIDRLNTILDQYDDDMNDDMHAALIDDHGIVEEISDDHQQILNTLDDDTEDSDDGLILGVTEDDDVDVSQRSAQTVFSDIYGQQCPNDVARDGLSDDEKDRCHDWNWCHPEKFPCKYDCSRRCKDCINSCGACNCPNSGLKDGSACPSKVDVMTQAELTLADDCRAQVEEDKNDDDE